MSVVFVSSLVSFVGSDARNGAEQGVAAMGAVHAIEAEAATARNRGGVVQEAPRRAGVGGAVADARQSLGAPVGSSRTVASYVSVLYGSNPRAR